MAHPTHTAIGTWSGGRFMHYGEPLDDDRLAELFTPGEDVRTVITADAYGAGEADTLLGRALAGVPRDDFVAVGAVGHDFYDGEREGAKGYPRFTDARLRAPDAYADYLRTATERSLTRTGLSRFDLLLLHNPDRTGYTSEVVWDGMAALRDTGLCDLIGIAPGPANGFTLDLIDCLERFGDRIDWAMIILNPLEPWPGELVLDAAAAHDVKLIARVVDYGGLFWDDVTPDTPFRRFDHRNHRPAGWVEAGRARMEPMREVAERHDLTLLQLAAQWDLAHPAMACVAPTLIQEAGGGAKPVAQKRAELAAVPPEVVLSDEEVARLRALGDNTGSMTLKGSAPDHDGPVTADRWPVAPELHELGRRWGIDAARDLRKAVTPAA